MTKHKLGDAVRTSVIRKAYAVYKDYDGNAPDGPVYAVCATKELGEQVASILSEVDDSGKEDEGDDGTGGNAFDSTKSFADFLVMTSDDPVAAGVAFIKNDGSIAMPFVDGFEYSASWIAEPTEEEEHKIATTLSEAIEQFFTRPLL